MSIINDSFMKTRDFINTFKTTKIMKTGGTMNFLKRAGAILMVVAIFASSCNKYADDFKQLNTKLDALATTVAGVTQLVTDMAATKAQVAALQTAVAALPNPTASIAALATSLGAVTTKIDAINASLVTISATGTATKAVVDQLKLDLAALALKTQTDDAALTAQLTALGTTVGAIQTAQAATLTTLLASNATLATSISAAQTSLNNLTTLESTQATAAAVAALQTLVQGQQATLAIILANTNMYNGDVNVTTDAEVTFYLAKIAQLGIVNGNVTINVANITAAQLANVATITKKITATIGTGNVTVNFKAGDAIDLSGLVSVKGNLTVLGSAKGAGSDVNLSALNNVGGNVLLTYDGPYASTSLAKVSGTLTLTNTAVIAATTPNGTTGISFPGISVTGGVFDGGAFAGVLTYPLATSVVMAGGVSSLTAVIATTVTLGSATYAAGLAITASSTAAATIDLSAATSVAGGALSVSGFNGTTVNLSKLVTSSGGTTLSVGALGSVNLTAYNEPAALLTVNGAITVSLPALVAGPIALPAATTVNLAVADGSQITGVALGAVKWLTAGAITKPVTIPSTVLTASIMGKSNSIVPMPGAGAWAEVTATSVTGMTSLTLGGTITTASVNTNAALTTLVTSGVINSLTVNGHGASLVSLSLGHGHYVGGPGSSMIVTSNSGLTSLTTSVDKLNTLTVTGNGALASCNFASYTTPLLGGTSAITINTNKLAADYTNAIAATFTTPYTQSTLTSADLHTLKAYLAATKAQTVPATVAITMAIDLDKVTLAGVVQATTTLSGIPGRLNVDNATHTVPASYTTPTLGLSAYADFAAIVQ